MSAVDPSTFIVAGRAPPAPPGLDVRNFGDPEVFKFEGRSRAGQPVTELVLHESVTRSALSTVAVLKRRTLGVHLILAPDGKLTQHGDLAHARLAHAGGHNGPSIGVEVVNPYYPYLLRENLPWTRTIAAPPNLVAGSGGGVAAAIVQGLLTCRYMRSPCSDCRRPSLG